MLCLMVALLPQARAARNPSDDPAAQAQALLALSMRQNDTDHVLALQTAQQALAIWQSLGDNAGIAEAFAQIGRCYMAQSELTEATRSYENALQLWRDLNNIQEQARALLMLGYIEDRKGEWSNSISLLTQAESVIEGTDDLVDMGRIAAGFADIFSQNGMHENALAHFQRALDYFHQASYATGAAWIAWSMGCTYYLMENYPEALNQLRQALTVLGPDSPDCNEYLGRVYVATGDRATGLRYLQSALDRYTRATNPREAARVQALIGQIYQQQGRLEPARRNYQVALQAFHRLSDPLNQAAVYYALGSLELKQGRLDKAEEYLRQSIEVTENIRRVSTSRDLTAAFSATVYDRYETYIDCLMQQYNARPAPGLLARAFETSEIARGRSLAELLRATEANLTPGLDPQLAERERSLRLLLRVKEDAKVALLSKAYKQEELAALTTELARLQADYQEVSEAIRARYPAYGQMTRPVGWMLQQIQEQVISDDQTVLLEYSLGAEQSYVWAVTHDRIRSYRLPAGARINEAAQRVYRMLAAPPDLNPSNDLDNALQELSAMVLSPVAAELNKRRILIVADGTLHYIPFQTLRSPQASGDALVADYEIINAPSASILGELRKAATGRQPTKVLAAFGDPVFASNYAQRKDAAEAGPTLAMQSLDAARLQNALRDVELNAGSAGERFDPAAIKPLFYARRELATLRDAASGGETFISSGFAASRDQLLGTDLSPYAILHFATHGLLDPKRPENSGLLLSTVNREGQAQNGFVGLQDIYGLRTPVDLVVLSACQTALGKDVRGEGLLGLTRGFMYAGASSVMASLWKVDDEATAELMHQTYVNMLQKEMTPAAALRAAQNTIRQRQEWRSPYYWAGFTLQGEYLEVIKPVTATRVAGGFYRKGIVTGGLMLLLVAVAVWYHRRRRRSQARLYSTAKK
jgi:CHAT domain-containing protein/tetratricopeptide (TPR) repeat protein